MIDSGGTPAFPGLTRYGHPAAHVLLLATRGNVGMCEHPARPDRDIVDRYSVRPLDVPLRMRVSQDMGRRIEDRSELQSRLLCDILDKEQGP